MKCFPLAILTTVSSLVALVAGGLLDDDNNGMFDIQIPTCQSKTCPPNSYCTMVNTGPICAIKPGFPCTYNDFCEGGYYCLNKGTCSGPDGLPEGSPCTGVGCQNGLYCDQRQNKCLKIGGGSFCTGDADCRDKCYSGNGCYCDNGKCIPNP